MQGKVPLAAFIASLVIFAAVLHAAYQCPGEIDAGYLPLRSAHLMAFPPGTECAYTNGSIVRTHLIEDLGLALFSIWGALMLRGWVRRRAGPERRAP